MKKLTTNIKEKCRAARTWWTEEVCRKSLSGITVIELVLILVIVIAVKIMSKVSAMIENRGKKKEEE